MKCTYLLASVALASATSAQVSVDWVATHDVAPGVNCYGRAVAVDATGRVAVGSRTFLLTPSGLSGDFETCLYGSDGTLMWSRTENVNDSDWCSSVAFDAAGGLFVAGGGVQNSFPSASGRTLLHYDALGNLLWSNNLTGTGSNSNFGYALALCPNGDVILAGKRNSDLSLERFDPAGNIVWSWIADAGDGGDDWLSAVAVGPGGDVWATGAVSSAPGYDIVVVRVTSAGVPLWIRTLDGTAHGIDVGNSLVVDAAGNTSVAGSIVVTHLGQLEQDAAIARWDPAGNLAWLRIYDGTAHYADHASQIALDPFGRIVAAGALYNTVTQTDLAAWCLDTSGNLIWHRTWNGRFDGHDWFRALAVDPLGAVWVCGDSSESGSYNPRDLTIASWDSTGAFRWSWRYPGASPGTNQVAVCAAVSGNNVIVAGSDDGVTPTQWDTFILKLNRTADEYCFGDGSSAPCPCANASESVQHAGCANALGLGARLIDNGASSLAHDSLVLAGSQMPPGDALYLQGTSSISGGAGELFGDGLRCAGGTLVRLGSSTNVGGASHFPDFGDPSVSVRGLVTTPGTRRSYQIWYRDSSAFCTPANFNFSNGLLITWTL